MDRKHTAPLLATLLIGVSGLALGDDGTAAALLLPKKAYIRVTAPDVDKRPIAGRLVSVDADTLIVQQEHAAWNADQPGTRKIPRSAIRSVEVRQGSRGSLGAGLAGGALGTLLGAALAGGVVAAACHTRGFSTDNCIAVGSYTIVPSAILGAVAGVAVTRKPVWTPAPLGSGPAVGLTIAPTPGRGLRAAISMGF